MIAIYSFIIVLIMIKIFIFVKAKNNIDKCSDKHERFSHVTVFLPVLNNAGLTESKVSALPKSVKNIKKNDK